MIPTEDADGFVSAAPRTRVPHADDSRDRNVRTERADGCVYE